MSDQDLIAAFLAKQTVTFVPEAAAYGADPRAERAAREAAKAAKAAAREARKAAKQAAIDAPKIAARQAHEAALQADRDWHDQQEAAYIERRDAAIWKARNPGRNYKLQARYDEEHGTINGYAPWQYNQEM